MKIIRRIIKNQPRQGQQFSTSHLLVTYNHTSWTRQDKMFALMKFKERSVAAFSHAFVLTIKIMFSLESVEHNVKYVVTSSDQSLIQSDKNEMHSAKNNLPEQNKQSNNVQEEVLESESKHIHLDNNLEVNNLTKTFTNKELIKQTANHENSNKFTNSSKFDLSLLPNVSSESNKKLSNKIKVSKCLRHSTVKLQKKNKNQSISNTNSILLSNIANKDEENDVITNLSRDSNCLEKGNIKDKNDNKLFEIDEYANENDFTEYKDNFVSNINKTSEDDNIVDAINADSINLPYQYLIEREIEDAKRKMSNFDVSLNETRKRRSEEVDEKHSTNSVELLTDVSKTEEISCLKKRKHISDNIASRSSDITDLVMEGLMFTIRQGQDTVAVIEQKTKLEVDEVLENSEKIETKKGEKCLRNSSLLGLENLITMIEFPKQTETEYKCENTIKPELEQVPWQSSSTSRRFSNENKEHNVANKGQYMDMYDYKYDENVKIIENGDVVYEEEEDIIPEALQDEIFQPSLLDFKERDKTENKLKVLSLLMDNTDPEESIKFETTKTEINPLIKKDFVSKICLKNNCSNNNSLTKSEELPIKCTTDETRNSQHNINMKHKYTFDNTRKCKTNVPIIISNEIINEDQIPATLQKILGKRSPMKHTSSNNKNETNVDSTEVHKIQSHQAENTSSTQLKGKSLDCNSFKSTQYLNSQIPVHTNNEIHSKSTSSEALKVELKDVSILENNLKLNEDGLHSKIVNIDKTEQLLPNEMRDITNEFYKDLSHTKKGKNLSNQKDLRSRRQTLNMLANTNLGETHIEIMKFFHDITRGAKVVVRRMSTKSIHNIIEKSSSLATCMQ